MKSKQGVEQCGDTKRGAVDEEQVTSGVDERKGQYTQSCADSRNRLKNRSQEVWMSARQSNAPRRGHTLLRRRTKACRQNVGRMKGGNYVLTVVETGVMVPEVLTVSSSSGTILLARIGEEGMDS